MSQSAVKSPCVSICVLNPEDVCEGCYRSAEEITQWNAYSEQERVEVLQLSQQRRIEDGAVM
ncbi:hypothetical protein SIN8267_00892 [Sinobacterium norvegicum]|uniref:DUF1289 domain-containing protein n=1 Tax=Sinobacterium norvegicum TaxID=1641715 RepID=A0ABN8EEN4_9GAMM|nr:DUF1289 domain-containing protein [Sinobacterium norvegicum]CAH0990793.1 hypothetical protein SIN8267_00892 [Sinobacterium norvegicum]